MADSIYKKWDEKLDELTSGDFKEGVLKAIRQLKEEVYNLKVDNFNQSMGTMIRDDKRIVLSAPEIIIGDVIDTNIVGDADCLRRDDLAGQQGMVAAEHIPADKQDV